MPTIPNRISKLERERLEAEIARALAPSEMTDRQLLEALLHSEGVELSDEEITAQMPRFDETGEVPGLGGITINDIAMRRRPEGDSK